MKGFDQREFDFGREVSGIQHQRAAKFTNSSIFSPKAAILLGVIPNSESRNMIADRATQSTTMATAINAALR